MERTHEPLHLVQWSFVHWKIMDIHTSFSWSIIFFNEAFEYSGISKLRVYVGTNTELLCAELCNFVQCHIFASGLSYCFVKGVLNIRHTNREAKKYLSFRPINLCLKFITLAKVGRLWVQSLNTTRLALNWIRYLLY
jgi:hypothetical protein